MHNIKDSYTQKRWSLDSLFSSVHSQELVSSLSALENMASEIEALRDSLNDNTDATTFQATLSLIEKFSAISAQVTAYSQLWFSEDTQNKEALEFMGKTDELLTKLYNKILFFGLWWKNLSDEKAQALMSGTGDLLYYLQKDRLFKDHVLEEAIEKVINTKDVNGINAVLTLYDMLTNKYVFHLEADGKTLELTRDALSVYFRSPEASTREAAYKELYRVYAEHEAVLTQMYVYKVRDWANENVEMRKFTSPINVRNRANDVPDDAIDTLLDVCLQEAPVFRRFFRKKAEWLAVPKLRRYDLYAPLKTHSDRKIDYSDAVKIVLDSFHSFSPIAGKLAERVFAEDRIDSEIRQGKRGGAFCYSVTPALTPWVLTNYTGEPRQVATLAHELGHAIHSMMAAGHSALTFHSSLPLAETASVFSEMLLTDKLLSVEKDRDVKRELLSGAIDDIYATVLRQAYFVDFEKQAHKAIAGGNTDLNAIYLSLLNAQFGDSIEVSDDFRIEWITIPHIYHTPFYCYAYSFGELLSLSLYKLYKENVGSAREAFLKILSFGGSASPEKILTEAGIDIRNPEFWRGGFKVITSLIDELSVL